MYHADTNRCTIWEYDYDRQTGTVENKRVFVKTADAHPDGLCVDGDGHVLAAIYGGSRIDIYSYRGQLIGAIELPVPNVTSCAVGGDDLETLYVTTASDGLDAGQLQRAPLSGQVFVVDIGRRD